ncbi:MAG TPA: 4-alpha-glucanotransferase, partial [Gemmataceae bacterium]|nr:4-alpha-glucanotransferase [Gemmataceae bacterium]
MATVSLALTELARAYGVETVYRDALGEERHASPETLVRILQVLGAPIQGPDDADAALRDLGEQTWRRPVEPVHVTWDGRPSQVALRLPAWQMTGRVSFTLEDEVGERRTGTADLATLPRSESATVGGVEYVACRLPLPGPLPVGRHRLTLQAGGTSAECLVLSAPTRTYTPPGGDQARSWGVFLPLYALHSERSWGAGDFTDLQALLDWVHGLGGGVVATLPLLAAFLDEPCEPGPYSPASRLFWNELYLDVTKAPELAICPAARALLGSADFRREIDALRGTPFVEHRALMALKRRVLEELARSLFAQPSARLDALRRYVAGHPHLESYARFRAVVERRRQTWPLWPGPLSDGVIGGGDFDEEARNYHLYVQWLCDEQLSALADQASR